MNRKFLNTLKRPFWLSVILAATFSCSTPPYYFRSNYNDINRLIHEEKNLQTRPFLKAHLKNGGVVILRDTWSVDSTQRFISGNGTSYDKRRIKVSEGAMDIPIDSVAIFETNKKLAYDESGRIAGLSILAGLDVALGVFCLTVPKACFGSCPTFYINPGDNFHHADAEGFSHAFFPSREYSDLDALPRTKTREKEFRITMKNEALETHCVNNVSLYAWPVKEHENVFQTGHNEFFLCRNLYPLAEAIGAEGNITSLLRYSDLIERFSLSDKDNLKSKEEIIITFDSLPEIMDPGLVIHFRQTLMTTYFIYNCMGYMGNYVGDAYAMIESGKMKMRDNKRFYEELGGIDVYSLDENSGRWIFRGEVYETGPIAVNKQMVPLKIPDSLNRLKLKLILNKGLWRLDYLALTEIKEKIDPLVIGPAGVLNKGKEDAAALALIRNPEEYLVSMPGDEYTFRFQLPDERDYELFLYSKGYYLEWMRNSWLKDEDLLKLRQMTYHPDKYFRKQAGEYKSYESLMEQIFWNSKIEAETFSYHDN